MAWFTKVNLVCAMLHSTSTIVVFVLGMIDRDVRDYSVPTMQVYAVNSSLVVTEPSRFRPNVLAFVVLPGFLSACWHWLWVALPEDRGERVLATGVNLYRWYDYAMSSSLMIGAIALLSGVAELWSLIGVVAAQWFLMVLSGVVEALRNDVSTRFQIDATILMAVYYAVMVWGPVFAAFDANDVPDFVTAIVATLFVLFALFGVVFFLAAVRWFEPEKIEALYATLSVTAKLVLQWLVFGGLSARTQGSSSVGTTIPLVLVGGTALGLVFWKTSP